MPGPRLSYAAASILLAVNHGYHYGFDIMDFIGLPSGTVYPALRRLEEARLITPAWEAAEVATREQRPQRKYYSITAAGEAALETAVQRYPLLEKVAPERQPRFKE